MKRAIVLVLAVLLVLAMFAGCKDKTSGETAESNSPVVSATAEVSATNTPEVTETIELPYAAGKFAADANGLALEKYEYPLPLTTSDDVITIWTSNFTPDYLPEEGFDTMPFPMEVQARTGVNVEYFNVPNASREENFGVRLASDDLLDIMCQPRLIMAPPLKKLSLRKDILSIFMTIVCICRTISTK
jgi:ABC-type glycerol-3-phosphate transport system substrate-binding protein